jgi:hypothetical protein
MQQEQSFKTPVVEREHYTIYIEQQTVTFMHCDVRKWTASIRKQMQADWNNFFMNHKAHCLAANEPHGCKKHQKFLKQMGFEFLGHIEGRLLYWRKYG